jgi:hypothetical protein
MSLPRLPLASVLNFLAFAADNPPPGMSDLMRAAHRLRTFRALCGAARDGKVKLFGTLRGGARQQINPIEFDQAFSLANEDGALVDHRPLQASVSVSSAACLVIGKQMIIAVRTMTRAEVGASGEPQPVRRDIPRPSGRRAARITLCQGTRVVHYTDGSRCDGKSPPAGLTCSLR